MALSISDVQNVQAEGMGAAIAATAQNVVAAYLGTAPDSNERLIAEDILSTWIREADQKVRETLSHQLRDTVILPRRLALKIAEDVESVAVPILLNSEVFTEEDLCALVKQGQFYHQITVAQRNYVPHAVSEALVETEREDVVIALVNNAGAKLSEHALHRVIDVFPEHETIHVGLVERAVMPVSVGDRLLTIVTGQLQQLLIDRFELPKSLACDLAGLNHDATRPSELAGVLKLIDYLHSVHRLTPAFLLRALCDENINLFEAGLKQMAHLPLEQVREQLRRDDMTAQIELFTRAGIPKPLTLAFRAGVDVIINGTPELYDTDNADAQIQAVVDQMVRFQEDIDRVGIEAVLTRLHRKIEAAEKEAERKIEARASSTAKTDTATLALVRTLRSPETASNNIIPLRPAARVAIPGNVEPAGAKIAAGGAR